MQFTGCVLLFLSTYVYSANVKVKNYHEEIGIPLAKSLRYLEERAFNNIKGLKGGGRISGGSITDISEIPFQAGIVIEIHSVILSCCGGVIISPTRVLTSAHCQYDEAVYTVALGTNFVFYGGHRVNATDFIAHPGYTPDDFTHIHDIAVLHIPAVTFTDLIQPVSLPNLEEMSNDFAGHMAVASGYGVTPEGWEQVLRAVDLQVITPEECSVWYGSVGSRDETICTSGAGGVGVCASDSGGPLTTVSNGRRILIGVTSFGAGCGMTVPSGYVRITQYISWILST